MYCESIDAFCGVIEPTIDLFTWLARPPYNSQALFCTGSFFAADGSADEYWDKLVAGTEKAPIATYILGPCSDGQTRRFIKLPRGGDLCDGVTYLGPQGIYNTPGGLKIAFLSGIYDQASHFSADLPPVRCAEDVASALTTCSMA